jgi:hypothetical protein
VVRGQRKGTVAIACWWSPYNQAEFWLLRDSPGQNGRFAALDPGGRAGARACDLTQSAQLRGPTMEYLEKVRSQFLSLRQSLILQKYFKASQFARHFLRLAAVFAAVLN